MPENPSVQLDAETGELFSLLYKIYDVDADIHPPYISKEEAIRIATETIEPVGKYKVEA